MKKLNRLANVRPEWSDRVAIIPVSVDRSPNPVAHHVARQGWTALKHFWSPRAEDGQSRAEQAFVVNGIPTAILVRPDGTIAWRGHPLAKYSGGVDLRDRIEAVLDGK